MLFILKESENSSEIHINIYSIVSIRQSQLLSVITMSNGYIYKDYRDAKLLASQINNSFNNSKKQ